LSNALLSLCLGCFILAGGCTTPGMHNGLMAKGQPPALGPKLLAVYMPWFGAHDHIDVGYASNDPAVLRKQIQEAKHRGISAFVVDWYGDANTYSDHNFGLMQAAASEAHFKVALLYNEPSDADEESTDAAVAALDKAYKDYIGPTAKYRDAYLTYNGHPLYFIFPKSGHIDWNHVMEHCSDWESPPLLIYKDEIPGKFNKAFAGAYAWVQPGPGGWAPDGSNWGDQYLKDFYKTMRNDHPDKITVGGAWPGFDDTAASWSLNRHIRNDCGKTLDDTLNLYQSYFDSSDPLPFMLIETWNDYEEGTAIERRTATNCGGKSDAATQQAGSR
jgi:hypothetical protein